MPPVRSTQERVKAATGEAHLRALLQALNRWAAEPLSAPLRAAVLSQMRKYQGAVKRGLCATTGGVPAFARHRGDMVLDEELEAVVELLKAKPDSHRGKTWKDPEPESLPWD